MKPLALVTAALLWQSALVVNIGTPAAPEHLRYQRAMLIPPNHAGLVCAELDATVFAHAASAAGNDLRLFAGPPGSPAEAETPYLYTESGPEPVPDALVAATAVTQHGGVLRFDLPMPARPYSEITLHLHATNFVGTVELTGAAPGTSAESLGTFGIFDLTRERLGRWTVLPMAESSVPVLHVRLRLRTPDGKPWPGLSAAVVAGASVPPSRERQTRFTPVASTTAVSSLAAASLATLHVPVHVPVERVHVTLPPEFQENFYREVTVSARPDRRDLDDTEIMDAGAIEQVRWPSGDPALRPIAVQQLSADATIGATLASGATVRVYVHNGEEPPLPIRRVTLEMRERRLCFLASPGVPYTLRYGDPALQPPVYDTSGLLPAVGASPAVATLGPEQRNPHWRPRTDDRRYLDRHPELFWLAVLLCAGMMGGSALHYVQHRGEVGRV